MADEKLTLNVFMCPDPWQPRAVCDGATCTASIRTETKYKRKSSNRVTVSYRVANLQTVKEVDVPNVSEKRLYVYQPIAKDSSHAGKKLVQQYLFKDTVTSPYCVVGRVCSEIEKTIFTWHRTEADNVKVEIPVPQFCGLQNLFIIYQNGSYREIFPNHNGEIVSDTMQLAMGSPYYEKYLGIEALIIAGNSYPVYYRSVAPRDLDHYLGYFRFETELLTSAEVVGCGVYRDGEWVKGGEGQGWDDFYALESDFVWILKYRGYLYKVKPLDNTAWSVGSVIYIGKNILSQSVFTSDEMNESAISESLFDSDSILPLKIYNYGGMTDDD